MSDKLLEDYLRVINAKDSEITRLLRENEALQLELRKKEDKYRSKLVHLKGELSQLQSHASLQVQRSHDEQRIQTENEALKHDVQTLRSALQRAEDHMQGVLKAAAKAQRHESHAREKAEADFRASKQSLEDKLFESVQRCAQLEALATAGGAKSSDAERECVRWKVEAQRLQHEHTDQHRIIKELKRKCREMVPRETAEAEALQLEDRHKTQVSIIEKECTRLRDVVREETHRAQRMEPVLLDSRKRIEELEHEVQLSRRQFDEVQVAYTQAKLHATATIEDLRKESTQEQRVLREQLEKERLARISLEGEVVVARQRIADAAAAAAQTSTKTTQDLQILHDDVAAHKRKLQEAYVELEASRRSGAQSEELMRAVQSKSAAARSEYDLELSKLKSQLIHAEDAVARKDIEVQHVLQQLSECKAHVQTLVTELGNERSLVAKREQDLRGHMLHADEQQRQLEESKRKLTTNFEDQVRMLERQLAEEVSGRQRDLQRLSSSSSAQVSELQDRLTACEERNAELRHECAALKDEVLVRAEKERSLLGSQTHSDERFLQLQLQLSERDASVLTLKRNLEQVCASLRSTQEDLESARRATAAEKEAVAAISVKLESALQSRAQREREVQALQGQCKDIETTALSSTSELQRELQGARDKIRQLSNDVNHAQQQLAMVRAESSRAERQWNEDTLTMQRDVVAPLNSRVDSLTSALQKCQREVSERDDRISDMTRKAQQDAETVLFLQSEVSAKERRLTQAADDLENCQSQLVAFRRAQQQLASAHEENKRVRIDVEALNGKIRQLELANEEKARELAQMHDREIDLMTELSNRKSEITTLKERYANLESLKQIGDQSISELQLREKDLLDKLEELRSAQHMMQICFDKQQEQLALSRRLRSDAGHLLSHQQHTTDVTQNSSSVQRLDF